MTAQATTQGEQQNSRGARTPLVMTAITLAAISVLALRQVRQGGDETAVPVTSNTTQSRMTEGAVPTGGLAERVGEERQARSNHRTDTSETLEGAGAALARTRSTSDVVDAAAARTAAPAVYIVESQDRALAVLAGLEQVNAFRATQGEPPLAAEVAWFDSADAEVSFWTAHEARRVREFIGPVVDLRRRPAGPCFAPESRAAADIREAC